MNARAHVLISGYVQGIFFRETTKRRAEELNVKGWVRNRHDGMVEAVFEGEEADVKTLVEFCKRGPPHAVVTNTELTWETYLNEFDDFEIRFG